MLAGLLAHCSRLMAGGGPQGWRRGAGARPGPGPGPFYRIINIVEQIFNGPWIIKVLGGAHFAIILDSDG